jgi:glycosyltransferase involved in cell wall biosynthesis
LNISIIGPTHPFRGGIAHYTTLLYRSLKKRNQIALFSFRRQYPQWLFPGDSDKDPSVKPLRESGVHYVIDSLNPLTWIQTVKMILGRKSEVVIIPWWTVYWTVPFLAIVSLLKLVSRIKILYLCHNILEHEATVVKALCSKIVLGFGDRFIVHSHEEACRLKAMLPRADIVQGFHPSYEDLHVAKYTRSEARQLLKIQGNVILFFGFIRPYKGLEYLLAAIPLIADHLKGEITAMVVGECWQNESKYQEQIDRLSIGKFVRRVNRYVPNEEIGLYFSAADLVVIPYVSATGSGILQLAFGAGRPVIATRMGALAEAVTHGRTGYLVPAARSDVLAQKIITFFKGKKGPQFEQAIAQEKQRFSWDKMAHLIESAFEAKA